MGSWKAPLGVGLGVGLSFLILAVVFAILWTKEKRKRVVVDTARKVTKGHAVEADDTAVFELSNRM